MIKLSHKSIWKELNWESKVRKLRQKAKRKSGERNRGKKQWKNFKGETREREGGAGAKVEWRIKCSENVEREWIAKWREKVYIESGMGKSREKVEWKSEGQNQGERVAWESSVEK